MGDIVKITFDVYCQRSLIARFDKLKQIFTEDCIRRSSCRDYCIKIHGPDQNQPPSSEDYVLQLERARKEKYLYRATESKQQNAANIENRKISSDRPNTTRNQGTTRSGTASTSDSIKTVSGFSQQKTDSISDSTGRSTVATGKAESQKTADVEKAALVLNNSNIAERLKELNINMQHALHHCLHEQKCPYYSEIKQCEQNYDQGAVNRFNHYIKGWKFIKGNYEDYIIDHLQSKKCGTGCPLWKFYIENKMYLNYRYLLKFADEGMVVYSKTNPERMGKICKDYSNYETNKPIGSGGFGDVYRYAEELAIKEEHKRPLIVANPEMFHQIIQLKHENVISVLEYLVGRTVEKEKRVFLFVMPYLNKRGLNDQFSTHKCIVDYMIQYPDEEENIFDNFLTLFLQVFKGLGYLHSKKIVHGDVKDANILVQQTCTCESPFRCKCPGHVGVTYVLTDMDLLCFDGQSLPGNYVKWAAMKLHEPAGTPGMKASELYFTGEKGEPCVSSKSDIWAGCVAMMKALVGKNTNDEAKIQITEFFEQVTISGKRYMADINNAYAIAHKLQKNVKLLDLTQERPAEIPFLKQKAAEIVLEFKKLKELLSHAQLVKETHHVSSYTYPVKFPLAMILSAVHVANSLHQSCLEKLPHVYNKPLWTTMKASMQIITDGVRFLPLNRPKATVVTEKLTALLLGFDDNQMKKEND